jgi:citrate lyase beta subunit
MRIRLTEKTIEELVVAICGAGASLREKHTLRQALYSVVMLAKIEQKSDQQRKSKPVDSITAAQYSRRRTKAILQQIAERAQGKQLGLAFDQIERSESE